MQTDFSLALFSPLTKVGMSWLQSRIQVRSLDLADSVVTLAEKALGIASHLVSEAGCSQRATSKMGIFAPAVVLEH
jgi:hypothetical protein